jgi:hypothetical protein
MMKNLNESMQYNYSNDLNSKNTFMLIKQELRRYEKELELKAGKGIIDDTIPEFGFQQTEMFSKKTDNNIKENYDE